MGYKVLGRGTKVEALWKGAALEGEVVGHELNPNRKPGIGRVTYEIKVHPAFANVHVPASAVTEKAS